MQYNACEGIFNSPGTDNKNPLFSYNSKIFLMISSFVAGIVAKKWEPGNLVPSRFSGEIRKVEARLGKLAKIRKVEKD